MIIRALEKNQRSGTLSWYYRPKGSANEADSNCFPFRISEKTLFSYIIIHPAKTKR